jgi:hypothetical protein
MTENYIFLGMQNSTHFFINISNNVNYNVNIPSQIYNVLINDKIITNPIENVVIYSFNEKCEIIIIQHTDNIKNNIFNKENLNSFFDVLINAKRNNSYIIQYDYDMKCYKSYYVDNIIPIPKELKIQNSTIVNIITSKPIENDNINL